MDNEQLARSWHSLGLALKLSSHYHQERKRFFMRWDNAAMLSGLLLSSGATIALVGDSAAHNRTALYLAFGVAVVQGFALVIGFGRKAWLHGDYCRRFIDLKKQWVASAQSEATFVLLESARLELEKDEPVPMPYLITRCHIDLLRREGYPAAEWPRLHWAKRLFAQYLPEVG